MKHFLRPLQLRSRPTASVSVGKTLQYERRAMSTSSSVAADAPKAAKTDAGAEAIANSTGVTSSSLQKTLQEKLGAQYVDIEDMSGMKAQLYS